MKVHLTLLTFAILFAIGVPCTRGQSFGQRGQPSATVVDAPFSGPFAGGVLTLDFRYVDDLLKLSSPPPMLRIIEVTTTSEAAVSSAHLALLLSWVTNGGVLWFHSNGAFSSVFAKVNPGIEITVESTGSSNSSGYTVYKESGAVFGNGTGELFVKGLLPQLVITDHPITAGVRMLYVIPDSEGKRFLKISGANFVPIIEYKNVKDGLHSASADGSSRLLFAVVEKGKGLIVIDTTQIGKKVWKGPDGNVYDGPRFYENIRQFSNPNVK